MKCRKGENCREGIEKRSKRGEGGLLWEKWLRRGTEGEGKGKERGGESATAAPRQSGKL